jgi:hypothetical protein
MAPDSSGAFLFAGSGRTPFGFSRTLIPLLPGPRSPAARQEDVPPSCACPLCCLAALFRQLLADAIRNPGKTTLKLWPGLEISV